jgi:iron complex outermembrane receptor protein
MRYYNDGALDGYYPDGVSEYLNTSAKDVFVRAQTSYSKKNHNIIFGVENSTFFYNGDQSHYANIDMNTGADPNDQTYFDLNPWLEFVKDKPVFNVASYAQYLSPNIFGKLQVTVSGRFDRIFFKYYDLFVEGQPLRQKNFQMFTPRIAVVYNLTSKLVLKAIYGKAFRTPSPTEMFGLNTFTLASNIDELKPEVVTNVDMGVVWEPHPGFNVRFNSFLVNFENQIAYSVANENLSTNVYTLKTAGVEFAAQYATQTFIGFANLSHSWRIDEDILDSTIAKSSSIITWAPSMLIKVGAMYKYDRFSVSSLFYYQNKVYRRSSDKFDGMENYRPYNYIDGWFTLDFNATYRFTKKSEIGISIKNLLNAERYLMKNNKYLFDYRLDGRTITGEYIVKF